MLLLIVVALCLVGILLVSRMIRPVSADKEEMPPVSNVEVQPVSADKEEMSPVSNVEVQPVSADKEEMPPEVLYALQVLDDKGVAEVLRGLAEANWIITKSRTYSQIGEGTIGNLCLLVSIVNAVAKAFGRYEELDQGIVVSKCAEAKMQYFEGDNLQGMLELNWLLPYDDAIVEQTPLLKLAIAKSLEGLELPVPNFRISVLNATKELGADYWKDDVEIIMSRTSACFVTFGLLYTPSHFDVVGVPRLE